MGSCLDRKRPERDKKKDSVRARAEGADERAILNDGGSKSCSLPQLPTYLDWFHLESVCIAELQTILKRRRFKKRNVDAMGSKMQDQIE